MLIHWFFNREPEAASLKVGGYVRRFFALLVLWVFLYQLWIFLHITWLIRFNPSSTAFMTNRLHALQINAPDANLKYKWVNYSKISNNLKRAVIASEDAKFLQHEGFDWQGIETAFHKNIKKGKLVAGGSSITQQLAKNLFLSSARTPWRKGQEAIITLMLEKILTKKRIFEIYLNVIEWGNGVFGIGAAAKHYYNISAASMTTTQAAKLAVMVPNPRFYDKHRSTRYLNRRTATIRARLHHVKVP